MRAITDLHDYVFMYLVGVLFFVGFILFVIIRNNVLTGWRTYEALIQRQSETVIYFRFLLMRFFYRYYNAFISSQALYYLAGLPIKERIYYEDGLHILSTYLVRLTAGARRNAEMVTLYGGVSPFYRLSQYSVLKKIRCLISLCYFRSTQLIWLIFGRYGSSFTQFHLFINLVTDIESPEDDADLTKFTFDTSDRFFSRQLGVSGLDAYKLTHNDALETAWTLLPSFILVLIAVPSLLVLFALDEIGRPAITVKAIGHQWYWSYEVTVSGLEKSYTHTFDSYMVATSDLKLGEHRNLTVDKPLFLPSDTHIRLLVTSMDVLHSWAIPAFGVKIDAVPGRLNQVGIFIDRIGVFYGQCSEICGTNHGFMPIQIRMIDLHYGWARHFAWLVSDTWANHLLILADITGVKPFHMHPAVTKSFINGYCREMGLPVTDYDFSK